jgi:hypothetical protein
MIVLACSVLQREKSFFYYPSNNNNKVKACRFLQYFSAPRLIFSRGYFFFKSDKTIKSCNSKRAFDGKEGFVLGAAQEKGQTNILEAES